MTQSLLHVCILQRFCAVQINRTATLACGSSSNCEVCNIVSLCIGSPLSRCCRFTTWNALLQRWMRHNSFLQSLGAIKRTPEVVSLGPEVQNRKLHHALKVSSFSLLCSLPVKVCLSSPGSSELCKTVQFELPYSSLEQTHRHHTYEVLHSCRCLFSFTNGEQISQFIQELRPSEGLMPLNCIIPLYLLCLYCSNNLASLPCRYN